MRFYNNENKLVLKIKTEVFVAMATVQRERERWMKESLLSQLSYEQLVRSISVSSRRRNLVRVTYYSILGIKVDPGSHALLLTKLQLLLTCVFCMPSHG